MWGLDVRGCYNWKEINVQKGAALGIEPETARPQEQVRYHRATRSFMQIMSRTLIYSVRRGLGLLGHAIKYQAFLILPLFFLLYLFIRHHQTGQEPIGCYKVDTNEKCDPLRKKKIPEIWALRRLSVQVNGENFFLV